jgi:hypothetical protein
MFNFYYLIFIFIILILVFYLYIILSHFYNNLMHLSILSISNSQILLSSISLSYSLLYSIYPTIISHLPPQSSMEHPQIISSQSSHLHLLLSIQSSIFFTLNALSHSFYSQKIHTYLDAHYSNINYNDQD